jgi:THO complex subunit 2
LQEQEQRIAIEAEEKRLKAALTAKREPTASTSRRASPAIGNLSNSEVVETKPNEDSEASMAIDSVAQEVSVISQKDDDLEFTVKSRFHGYPN